MNLNVAVAAADQQVAQVGTAAQPIFLDEEMEHDFVPTEEELLEYAVWLGMDVEADEDLLWIAHQGLTAPLPTPWRACQSPEHNDVFYFNNQTGESSWDHPVDERHRELYQLEKKKKRPVKLVTVSCSAGDGCTLVACTSMAGHVLSTLPCEAGQNFAGVRALLSEELQLEVDCVRLIFPNAGVPDDEELVESCPF